jgi:hypothetical protein
MSRALQGACAPGSRQRGLADDYLDFTASRRSKGGAEVSSRDFPSLDLARGASVPRVLSGAV